MTKQASRRSISVRSRDDRPITALASRPGGRQDGDRDPGPYAGSRPGILECLVNEQTLGRFLEAHSIDIGAIRKCLRHFCRVRRPSEGGHQQTAMPVDEVRRLLADMDPATVTELLGNLGRKHDV